MKKILLFALMAICLQNVCAKEIDFIYINGSNANGDKEKQVFYDEVKRLHPDMKKTFEKSTFANEKFLGNGKNKIKSEGTAFFWGNMSQNELERLNQKLNYMKVLSPKIAQMLREMLAYYLHDAIWVSKYPNMGPILEDLHKKVMEDYNKGNQVVLFGYSAGSFVSYEYMLRRSRYMNPEKYLEISNLPEYKKKKLRASNPAKTCPYAIEQSRLAIVSQSDEVILDQNVSEIEKVYLQLDDFTEKYCAPDDAVKGVVNFASPLSLFYSELADLNKTLTQKSKALYIYLIESDKFLININWANDPLGFPITRNFTVKEFETLFDINIEPKLGYIYNNADKKSRAFFLLSHLAYWNETKSFAKQVVKAYENGYGLCGSEH